MKVKIFGEVYDAVPRKKEKCDNYYSKGLIVEQVPFDKLYTHVAMVDGYQTGVICWGIIIAKIVAAIAVLGALAAFVIFAVPKFHILGYDDKIDDGTREEDKDFSIPVVENVVLVRYNAFMSYKNGKVDINLVNGDKPATVQLVADGIECDAIKVKANEEVSTMDVKLKSKDQVISAKLLYTYEGKETEYTVSIENMSEDYEDNGADVTFETEEVIYE